MTTDVVRLFAGYNAYANTEMNKYISLLNQSDWEKDFGGYYKSIRALCSHLYIGDFTWLKRFGLLRTFDYLNDPVFNNTFLWDSIPFDTTGDYIIKRKKLDTVINLFAAELKQEDLDNLLQYKNWKNEDQSRNFGGLIIHVFNHQTHHRGMISLYLDLLGIDNDFSNLLNLV